MSFKRNFDLNEDFRRGMAEVKRELQIMGLQMEKEASKILDDEGRSDTGLTKNRTKSLVEMFLNGMAVRLSLGTNTNYAQWVHDGREPGPVPYEKKSSDNADPLSWGYTFLYPWVKLKLKIADPFEIKAAAGAIAQKIKNEGTEGTPYLDMTLDRFQDKFVQRAQAAFVRGFDGR